MNYREFGKTGEKISALGFGCMRFPEYQEDGKWFVDQEKTDAMVRRAYELGVNYFDTAPFYCNQNSEEALGKAVKPFRDKILLSTKCPADKAKDPAGYRRFLEQSLRRLDTDHVDFYHFWGTNKKDFDENIVAAGLLDEARKVKEEGLIRHISFSFHDDPSSIKYIIDTAIAHGVPMESMLCQYNLLDRSNEEMISYAHEMGLGTVAMGPVGGGRLSAPTDLYTKLTGKPAIATYELAFKFCLGHPGLSCALSGMQTIEMVEQNAAIASSDTVLTEAEWQQLGESMEQLKKFNDLYCTGCKYCQPCPAEIDIPKIFNLYTYYNVYGLKDHAINTYAKYKADGGKTIADCLNCGKCEKACPQHLKIRQDLERVDKILTL
ncbi:MAG: aldo/keto reductase [Lachnospiraceae bacterium]|nr:aldo/keto reductase [Lachnospiraceae bacterium]